MIWAVAGVLVLVVAWFVFMGLPRLVADFDTKVRLTVAKQFMDANPQGQGEDKTAYMRRVHWFVLQNCGLPPLSIVRIWLSGKRMYILASAEMIEQYLNENLDKPLPSGSYDIQIRNGQGLKILNIVRAMED